MDAVTPDTTFGMTPGHAKTEMTATTSGMTQGHAKTDTTVTTSAMTRPRKDRHDGHDTRRQTRRARRPSSNATTDRKKNKDEESVLVVPRSRRVRRFRSFRDEVAHAGHRLNVPPIGGGCLNTCHETKDTTPRRASSNARRPEEDKDEQFVLVVREAVVFVVSTLAVTASLARPIEWNVLRSSGV